MRFNIRQGKTLTDFQLNKYLDFLREGGAIKYFKTAKKGLESAFAIVELEEQENLVGIGAVKQIRSEYNLKISERSGYPLDWNANEIGYIAVDRRYRGKGLSKDIVSQLLKETTHYHQVFATTSNPAMSATFDSQGFIPRGTSWEGKEGDALTLWVKK
jgi:predicted GNAT family N-acyltransferase